MESTTEPVKVAEAVTPVAITITESHPPETITPTAVNNVVEEKPTTKTIPSPAQATEAFAPSATRLQRRLGDLLDTSDPENPMYDKHVLDYPFYPWDHETTIETVYDQWMLPTEHRMTVPPQHPTDRYTVIIQTPPEFNEYFTSRWRPKDLYMDSPPKNTKQTKIQHIYGIPAEAQKRDLEAEPDPMTATSAEDAATMTALTAPAAAMATTSESASTTSSSDAENEEIRQARKKTSTRRRPTRTRSGKNFSLTTNSYSEKHETWTAAYTHSSSQEMGGSTAKQKAPSMSVESTVTEDAAKPTPTVPVDETVDGIGSPSIVTVVVTATKNVVESETERLDKSSEVLEVTYSAGGLATEVEPTVGDSALPGALTRTMTVLHEESRPITKTLGVSYTAVSTIPVEESVTEHLPLTETVAVTEDIVLTTIGITTPITYERTIVYDTEYFVPSLQHPSLSSEMVRTTTNTLLPARPERPFIAYDMPEEYEPPSIRTATTTLVKPAQFIPPPIPLTTDPDSEPTVTFPGPIPAADPVGQVDHHILNEVTRNSFTHWSKLSRGKTQTFSTEGSAIPVVSLPLYGRFTLTYATWDKLPSTWVEDPVSSTTSKSSTTVEVPEYAAWDLEGLPPVPVTTTTPTFPVIVKTFSISSTSTSASTSSITTRSSEPPFTKHLVNLPRDEPSSPDIKRPTRVRTTSSTRKYVFSRTTPTAESFPYRTIYTVPDGRGAPLLRTFPDPHDWFPGYSTSSRPPVTNNMDLGEYHMTWSWIFGKDPPPTTRLFFDPPDPFIDLERRAFPGTPVTSDTDTSESTAQSVIASVTDDHAVGVTGWPSETATTAVPLPSAFETLLINTLIPTEDGPDTLTTAGVGVSGAKDYGSIIESAATRASNLTESDKYRTGAKLQQKVPTTLVTVTRRKIETAQP